MKRRIARSIALPLQIAVLVGAALSSSCTSGSPATPELAWEVPLRTDLEKLADTLTNNVKPWAVPDIVFRVEDYGAVADGRFVNTAAIQKAIDACSAKGGGVVRFTNGDYVTGTIELRSGVMIEVAKNARILGSTDLKDYPEKIEQFKSVMSENHKLRRSLIYAEKCDNVGIRGEGEIYFRGESENFPDQPNAGELVGRPLGIRMVQCSNVVLQGIFLHNSSSWMQSYLDCKDLIFDNIRVVNQANLNNDGFDLDGCTNVIVRNCYVNAEDDAMCLKGASKMPSQNILIENSTFITSCNAFKIGTDTEGDFRNIVARNLKLGGIPESTYAFKENGHEANTGITLATVDGGNVEDILISNVSIDRTNCPVFIRVGNRSSVMPGTERPPVGTLKKVVIENVSGQENFAQGSLISGINGHYVEDVIIRNYKISAAGSGNTALLGLPVPEQEDGYPDAIFFSAKGLPSFGFFIRHAQRINIIDSNVTTAKPDARPEIDTGGDVKYIVVNGRAIN